MLEGVQPSAHRDAKEAQKTPYITTGIYKFFKTLHKNRMKRECHYWAKKIRMPAMFLYIWIPSPQTICNSSICMCTIWDAKEQHLKPSFIYSLGSLYTNMQVSKTMITKICSGGHTLVPTSSPSLPCWHSLLIQIGFPKVPLKSLHQYVFSRTTLKPLHQYNQSIIKYKQ